MGVIWVTEEQSIVESKSKGPGLGVLKLNSMFHQNRQPPFDPQQ